MPLDLASAWPWADWGLCETHVEKHVKPIRNPFEVKFHRKYRKSIRKPSKILNNFHLCLMNFVHHCPLTELSAQLELNDIPESAHERSCRVWCWAQSRLPHGSTHKPCVWAQPLSLEVPCTHLYAVHQLDLSRAVSELLVLPCLFCTDSIALTLVAGLVLGTTLVRIARASMRADAQRWSIRHQFPPVLEVYH
jgi:hypothetical protein